MTRDPLREVFQAALAAAEPSDAVRAAITLSGDRLTTRGKAFDLLAFDSLVVVGAGKAACPMAGAVEDVLDGRISAGLVITKYGHTRPLERITAVEAGHPVPDAAGVAATEKVIRMLAASGERTLVIVLLSGGGSALLVAPVPEITLADKQVVTDLLLRSGARIEELNAVRKHLSRVKGGRLAELARPATVLTLILSDVIGDRLDVIGSGPTAPDSTTFGDALAVLDRYGLRGRAPGRVLSVLDAEARGDAVETPKVGNECFRKVENVIIGGLGRSLEAARDKARSLGYEAEVITAELAGEAREAATFLAGKALAVPRSTGRPRCLISGGETTVTVRGRGRGGRNQELALAFALEVEGQSGITILSAGTDGTDGPTDAAGAIVDGGTATEARRLGLSPERFLDDNDSYTFFAKLDALMGGGCHLKTGPTGTNVMDVQIMVVER
jgi:hydroxypyruvate reductase